MSESQDYLAKARESFAGAESELIDGRFNNCARSVYYACFQAAIAALLEAGISPKAHLVCGDMAAYRRALLVT
jgi:uncharacterized protein (UPF0332 family)